MICYQDEKIYGPAPSNITPEELDANIRRLEIELYGHPLDEVDVSINSKVYDVTKKQLVDIV